MIADSLTREVRYALRSLRSSPVFASSVAGTIGLGLGILCSAFTILNGYLLKPIDLPRAKELYALSWDTEAVVGHGFRRADFEGFRDTTPVFSSVAAANAVTVMDEGLSVLGLVVTGNYFQLLGARAVMGRTLLPEDATAPGAGAVAVLSYSTWRSRYAEDPAIIGKEITLGRQRYEVVGVVQPGAALPGEETVAFWVPLTMARAFDVPDPWEDAEVASLRVIGRLRRDTTEAQARAWFETWVRQRFPTERGAGTRVNVRMEPRGTRIPLNTATLTMFSLIVAASGMVLLIACANVMNIMLARGVSRKHEIAVRVSLGATRWRVVRQLLVESLVLAVPAAAVGLGLTFVTARVVPFLLLNTLPDGAPGVEPYLAPLNPDARVLAVLVASAVAAALIVGLSPALHVTKRTWMGVSKGKVGVDSRVSRLRTALIATQVGTCALFLVGATGLIEESKRLGRPDVRLEYEGVADVRVADEVRAEVAARLASESAIRGVAAAWRPPLAGPLPTLKLVASGSAATRDAGFLVVSPGYFDLYGIQLLRGRAFSEIEADRNAALVVVSAATAHRFWPGQDPIGQTLHIVPARDQRQQRPAHDRVQVVAVAEDVTSGWMGDGLDATCVYFPTTFRSADARSLLVRARDDSASLRGSIAAAVRSVEPDATFEIYPIKTMIGMQLWAFQAFSAAAALLGLVGLLLAFSGTYAVVSFLVTQRTREFGIRMALGATVQRIVRAMVGEALRIAAIGGAAGLVIAALLARASDATIEVMPTLGPRPFVIGAAIVLIATVAAALLPALRTGRIDPSEALRVE